ncbi:MAG: LCP family protein [Chloroflexi bacterium]|nr:LCP family protein [Chloroflexota bacterium]
MTDSPHAQFGFAIPDPQRSRSRLGQIVFTLFSLLFVSGGIASGYVFVTRVSAAIEGAIARAERQVPTASPPPVVSRPSTTAVGVSRPPKPTAAPAVGVPTATSTPEPELVGQERINILLLGVDQRPDETGQPTRTDTMLVITLDPANGSAGMLSIPRDLWVPIPLDDRRPIQDKITTAHFYGDFYQFPGGGPALAKKTVQYNLGVRIHYYARVDFPAFRRIVDTLGGIHVDVPVTLVDNEYPTDDYGFQRVYIPAGCQQLNGDLALKYARSRHMDSDFGRMKRQQAVLLAIRKRALRLDVIPKVPQLALEFAGAIKTDIPLPEVVNLARIGKEIDPSAIVARSIEGPAVQGFYTSGGADALLPIRPEIQKIVLQVFSNGPTNGQAASAASAAPTGGTVAAVAPAATPTPPTPTPARNCG